MATSMQSSTDLPGHLPPLSTVSPTDHSAWILIATCLGLIYTLFFGALRALVRGSNLGPDDYVLAPAIGVSVVQSGLMFAACAKGFGKAFDLISEHHQLQVQQLFYTSNILVLVIVALSKLSVPLILLKMSPVIHHKITFYLTIGGVAVSALGSILTVALQCGPTTPWLSVDNSCGESRTRWRVVLALDILTEIWIMILPVYVVWGLQTTLSRKWLVFAAFAIRIGIVVAIAFRLSAYSADAWNRDPSLLQIPFAVWTQTEMNLAIICATVTGLQKYLKDFDTHFGGLNSSSASAHAYPYGTRYGLTTSSKPNSSCDVKMTRLKPAATSNIHADEEMATETPDTHPVGDVLPRSPLIHVQCDPNDNRSNSITSSSGSQQMIIRKDVSWTVTSEARE